MIFFPRIQKIIKDGVEVTKGGGLRFKLHVNSRYNYSL